MSKRGTNKKNKPKQADSPLPVVDSCPQMGHESCSLCEQAHVSLKHESPAEQVARMRAENRANGTLYKDTSRSPRSRRRRSDTGSTSMYYRDPFLDSPNEEIGPRRFKNFDDARRSRGDIWDIY